MTLPALATIADLEARGVDVSDEPRAQAALDDASALIRAEAGKTWVTDDALDDDRPDVLLTICVAVARRVLENPDGVQSESLGDASVTYSNSSNDVYLKSSERALIRTAAGRRGIGTVATTREDPVGNSDFGIVGSDGTIYAEVTPEGQPIPYLSEDQLLP